jgi:DNA-binding NarL/FixJ family response regulator
MKTEAKKRILVVEDHPLYRDGLCQLVNKERDLVVCGEAGDSRQAITLMEHLRPDMAIIDITLGNANGIELLKQVRAIDEELPVLIISMHDESLYAERVLRAGGRGYVMKHEAPERIRNAIRQILAGDLAFTPKFMEKIVLRMTDGRVANKSLVETLSDRELQVLELIGRGIGTRQIAEHLNLSVPTINSFRARIKEKLGLSSASELAVYAARWAQRENGIAG